MRKKQSGFVWSRNHSVEYRDERLSDPSQPHAKVFPPHYLNGAWGGGWGMTKKVPSGHTKQIFEICGSDP